MKSKIQIRLAEDNQPIIRIDRSNDITDVRDEMIKRFSQDFGGCPYALVQFGYAAQGELQPVTIRPIHEREMPEMLISMWQQAREAWEKQQESVCYAEGDNSPRTFGEWVIQQIKRQEEHLLQIDSTI